MSRSVSILRAIALAGTVLAVSGASPAAAQSDEPYFVCWSNFYRAQPFTPENFVLRYLSDGRSWATEQELEAELEEYVLAQEPSLVLGSTNCNTYNGAENAQIWLGKLRTDPPQIKIADIVLGKTKKKDSPEVATETKPGDEAAAEAKSAAQIAAEAAAARKAKYEAEFQAKQAEYERKLAEQQKQVEDYKRAQDEVARAKAEQQAKADAAAAAFKAEQEAYAETVRQHEAQEAAAKKLLADFDKRHGLGQNKEKASTDTDANQCVTTGETKLNATFKGNTAASIINGCGQPVDVRICLMTSTKGWNCGVGYGVAPQGSWSWSSFDATGPVFVHARISGRSEPLGSPQ